MFQPPARHFSQSVELFADIVVVSYGDPYLLHPSHPWYLVHPLIFQFLREDYPLFQQKEPSLLMPVALMRMVEASVEKERFSFEMVKIMLFWEWCAP